MQSKSKQNNHIQVPKSILESFSFIENIKNDRGFYEKHNMIYQMGMDGVIVKKDIKDCDAQIGVYSDYKEQQLASIETAFGDIKKKIIDSEKANSELRLTEEEISLIRLFFMTSLSRSQEYVKQIKDGVILLQFISGLVDEYIMQEIEKETLFDEFMPCIIGNQTDENFILPQRCWYSLHVNGYALAVMPITPKTALAFYKPDKRNGVAFPNTLKEQIDEMNRYAIYQEFHANKRAVYAKNKEDLEKYIPFLKEMKL